MKLWFVDDKRDNHQTWSNSFPEPIKASCELRSFFSVSELTDEFTNGNVPDILFLDFFIGEVLGIEVIRWFENKAVRPVLIAHSSMKEASVGMVREGADFYLEKIKNKPHTESIRLRSRRSTMSATSCRIEPLEKAHNHVVNPSSGSGGN